MKNDEKKLIDPASMVKWWQLLNMDEEYINIHYSISPSFFYAGIFCNKLI